MPDLFERLPKYVQIKEAIRQEIEDGILREGQQLPSEAALIDRFGASKMTVIRALQELVQEGYLRRVQGKGTYVTRPPQHGPLIGVLVPGTDRGIFTVILYSIEERAHQLGFEVVLCSTDEDTEKVDTFAERLIARHAAGVIAVPLERVPDPNSNLGWYNRFKEAQIPVVLVDRDIEKVEHTLLVETNNEEIMADLTREVLKRGHRRILAVRWEEIQSTTTDARVRGLMKAAKEEDPKAEFVELISISDQKPFSNSIEDFQSLLFEYEPTVIMCINDQIAMQVFSLLSNISARVADGISITGFDDLPVSQAIGLTTVHQPLAEEGRAAVELLHQVIKGESVQSIMIPSHTVIRTSLNNPPQI